MDKEVKPVIILHEGGGDYGVRLYHFAPKRFGNDVARLADHMISQDVDLQWRLQHYHGETRCARVLLKNWSEVAEYCSQIKDYFRKRKGKVKGYGLYRDGNNSWAALDVGHSLLAVLASGS